MIYGRLSFANDWGGLEQLLGREREEDKGREMLCNLQEARALYCQSVFG